MQKWESLLAKAGLNGKTVNTSNFSWNNIIIATTQRLYVSYDFWENWTEERPLWDVNASWSAKISWDEIFAISGNRLFYYNWFSWLEVTSSVFIWNPDYSEWIIDYSFKDWKVAILKYLKFLSSSWYEIVYYFDWVSWTNLWTIQYDPWITLDIYQWIHVEWNKITAFPNWRTSVVKYYDWVSWNDITLDYSVTWYTYQNKLNSTVNDTTTFLCARYKKIWYTNTSIFWRNLSTWALILEIWLPNITLAWFTIDEDRILVYSSTSVFTNIDAAQTINIQRIQI
jgi:hypothetical protein